MKVIYNCIVCNKPLSGKQRSFCSVKCKNEHFLSYDVLKKRAFAKKALLVNASGGECKRCGYSASLDALSFYDKNGETMHIDTNVLANSNYEKLVKKLKNGQVLCRNCYEEVQNQRGLDSSLRWNDGKDCPAPRIDTLKKKFAENLLHCGVKHGQTIVLGVSGGVDSISMLDLFAKSGLRLNIIVAHMNHNVRKEAIHDEKLAAEHAKKRGFKFIAKTLSTTKQHSHILENVRMSNNTEERLRDERRRFLLETAKKYDANFVALAHNADDQAETFIMNAVRGSGPAGLGAMKISDKQIIRPLLNFSRAEIESFATQNKLEWNEDITNQDISYSRNYVRHRILPLLNRLNPEYLSAIHRTTHLQRQIDSHFKEEAYRLAKDTRCEHLRRLDKPLLYEVLGLLYEEAKGDRQNLTLDALSAIENLIQTSEGTKSVDLPNRITVRRVYDILDFYAKKEHNTASAPSIKKLKLGTQKFGGWRVTVSPCHPESSEGSRSRILDSSVQPQNDEIIIDAETLPNVTIRTRKPGDRIASIGPKGTKKLQDLFVDAKIDREKRDFWPVITDKTQILWVPGLAKARFQLKTKKLLKINIVEEAYETIKKK